MKQIFILSNEKRFFKEHKKIVFQFSLEFFFLLSIVVVLSFLRRLQGWYNKVS